MINIHWREPSLNPTNTNAWPNTYSCTTVHMHTSQNVVESCSARLGYIFLQLHTDQWIFATRFGRRTREHCTGSHEIPESSAFFLPSFVISFFSQLLRCLRDRFIFGVAASSSRKDKLVRTSNRDSVKYNQTRRATWYFIVCSSIHQNRYMYGFAGGQPQNAACSSKIHSWGDFR